jgi:hypothetical protein
MQNYLGETHDNVWFRVLVGGQNCSVLANAINEADDPGLTGVFGFATR